MNSLYGSVLLLASVSINIGLVAYTYLRRKNGDKKVTYDRVAAHSEAEQNDNDEVNALQNEVTVAYKVGVIIILSVLLIIAAVALLAVGNMTNIDGTITKNEKVLTYQLNNVDPNKVLPGASFIIYENSLESFRGSFKGDNKWRFDFVSQGDDDVFFKLDDSQISEYGAAADWIGFHFYVNAVGGRIVDLYDGKMQHSMPWTRNDLAANRETIDAFMGSRVVEFFTQLSIKLKYIGYFSKQLTQTDPLYSIHHFGQYFHKMSRSQYIDDTQWLDLDGEISKAQQEVYGTAPRRLFWPFVDDSECLRPDKCGGGNNACIGGCGDSCHCWDTVGDCEDCQCHKGCAIHDFHCSCSGTWEGHEASWGCCLDPFTDWDCEIGYVDDDVYCNAVPSWVTSGV